MIIEKERQIHFKYKMQLFRLLICLGLIILVFPLWGGERKGHKTDSSISFTHAVSIQWIGIVFHPKGGTYPDRYIRKLDPRAYFVVELGGILTYEYRIFDRGYLKAAVAFNLDCANVPAGFFHIGTYYQVLNKKRHILILGLGPTLVFRENWDQFPEYVGDEFFRDNEYNKWQYRFVIFGAIEYNFRLSKTLLLNASLIPGGHLVMTTSFGLKYIIK
jgi:hypothetical protein